MQPFDVQSVGIDRRANEVFKYVANPLTLSEWTQAFKRVNGRRAEFETPAGAVTVDLQVDSDAEAGTVDWIMTFPDGSTGRAHARVVQNVDDSSIFSFVLLAPPVPQEQVEGTLEQQKVILRDELRQLKRLLERHA